MRSLDDARRWAVNGTKLLLDEAAGMSTSTYDVPSLLPGWTGRHLLAHVAANADALVNLARWAATGVVTPMYASQEAREAGIAWGIALPTEELDVWLIGSADRLDAATRNLTDAQWTHVVRTAQGRLIPAAEIPWLRAREVWVHAVDLDVGVGFKDLPDDFLEALCADVVAKRGAVPQVAGPLAERTAWLTGRPHRLTGAPALGPWL